MMKLLHGKWLILNQWTLLEWEFSLSSGSPRDTQSEAQGVHIVLLVGVAILVGQVEEAVGAWHAAAGNWCRHCPDPAQEEEQMVVVPHCHTNPANRACVYLELLPE